MFSLEREKKPFIYKGEILDEMKEMTGEENPTANQVLEHLLGSGCDYPTSELFKVYRYKDSKRNMLQRINFLILFLPMLLLVMPVQWVLFGKTGFKRHTKVGAVIDFLIGFED